MAIVNVANARKDIPLVSVIAVCYNHSKYVEETLESILNQTYQNIELIIIDSNSPDNSVEIIEKWIKQGNVECTFIKQLEPKNICQNLNLGLRIVKGKYFQGISCDDLLVKDKIQRQVEILEHNEQAGMVFGNAIKIDSESKNMGRLYSNDNRVYPIFIEKRFTEGLKQANFIPAPSVLIRTKCSSDIGRYDEEIEFEDWDYWLRIALSNWTIHFDYALYSKYRMLSSSMWNSKDPNMLIATIDLFNKHNLFYHSSAILNYFKSFSGINRKHKSRVFRYMFETNKGLAVIYLLFLAIGNSKLLRGMYRQLFKKQS